MIWRFGRFSIDPNRLELREGGEPVAVEPQVFSLLAFLIENCDRVLSKDEIIETVWQGRIVSDGTLNSRINAARRAIGDNGTDQAVIKTYPRRGFRFIAEIEGEEGQIAAAADPESSDATEATLALPDKPSIAVLSFDNMSGDPEQEYFSDGLAEDIITDLSKIERLRVIARNSAFAYKGQFIDLRRIADELGVRYVLEGSVRRSGNRLRITAQLSDATDGSHLWAERYDRSVDDIFDIQDEITKEIVTSLRVKLTDGEEARVWARGTDNIEAWQYGVRAFDLIMHFTSSSHLEARALAEKAIELDPNYAHAWATLGFTYWMDGRIGSTGDVDARYSRAAEIAEHAMALDDSVSWCIGLSAVVAAPLGRHDEGVSVARRGVELHPSNADVRAFLAFTLLAAGNYREAEEHYRAAISLNPFCQNWYRNGLARTLVFLGEFDEALTLSDEILETEPAHLQVWLNLAYIYGWIGRETDARKAIDQVRQIAPNLRALHISGLLMINDAAATKRFIDGVRKAGLPE